MADPGLDPLYVAAAKDSNIDPLWLKAHAHVESGQNINAPTTGNGEVGLFQINPETAKGTTYIDADGKRQPVTDPSDPRQGAYSAAQLLNRYLQASNGDPAAADRMYNGGPNTDLHGPATASYPPKVAAAMRTLPPPPLPVAPPGVAATKPSAAASAQAPQDPFDAAFPAAPLPATSAPPPLPTTAPAPGAAAAPADFETAFPATPLPPAPAAAPASSAPVVAPTVPGVTPEMRSYANALVGGIGTGIGGVAKSVNRLVGGAFGSLPGATPPADVQADMAAHPYVSTAGNVIGGAIGVAPALAAGGEVLAAAPGAETLLAGGRAVRSLLTAVPGAAPVADVVAAAGRGAIQGAATNVLTSTGEGQDYGSAALSGAEVGGSLGAVSQGAGMGVRKLLGIGAPDADRLALAAKLKAVGIDTPPSRLSPDPAIQQGGSTPAQEALTRRQITQAGAGTFGLTPDELGPGGSINADAINAAKSKVGAVFDTTIPKMSVGPETYPALQQVEADAANNLDPAQMAIFQRHYNNVVDMLTKPEGTGMITGKQLENLVNSNGSLTKAGNPRTPSASSQYIDQIRDTLLDGAGASSADPESQAAAKLYQQAKFQWKNLKTVQDAIDPSDNMIDPARLYNVVKQPKHFGADALTTGNAGTLGDLAVAGQGLLKPFNPAPQPGIIGSAARSLMPIPLGFSAAGLNAAGQSPFWAPAINAGIGILGAGGPRISRLLTNTPEYLSALQRSIAPIGLPEMLQTNPLLPLGVGAGVNQLRNQPNNRLTGQ